MKKLFLIFALVQMSFAMDPSVEAALKCIEKKKMDVHAVEKIDGKVYARGGVGSDRNSDRVVHDNRETVFEYKKGCSFQKRQYLRKFDDQRKGLLSAMQNDSRDSIKVLRQNSVLWSCSKENRRFLDFRIVNQSKLLVGCSNTCDSLWLLDDKCQWTFFETNAKMPFHFFNIDGVNSRFFYYEIGKRRTPYIVVFDSLWSKHWGTSLSFLVNASTRTVACGLDFFKNPDDTEENRWLVKCVRWTGNNFVEFTLPHKVDTPPEDDSLCACPLPERLFPCGDGICVQNYETKKIEILVDE